MLRRNQKGFTLVELMIVVIIVGILAAVAIPMYQGATERAKASEAVAALGTIRGALRVYFAEHGTYVNASFTDGDQVIIPVSVRDIKVKILLFKLKVGQVLADLEPGLLQHLAHLRRCVAMDPAPELAPVLRGKVSRETELLEALGMEQVIELEPGPSSRF